jgi:hypothetical protein
VQRLSAHAKWTVLVFGTPPDLVLQRLVSVAVAHAPSVGRQRPVPTFAHFSHVLPSPLKPVRVPVHGIVAVQAEAPKQPSVAAHNEWHAPEPVQPRHALAATPGSAHSDVALQQVCELSNATLASQLPLLHCASAVHARPFPVSGGAGVGGTGVGGTGVGAGVKMHVAVALHVPPLPHDSPATKQTSVMFLPAAEPPRVQVLGRTHSGLPHAKNVVLVFGVPLEVVLHNSVSVAVAHAPSDDRHRAAPSLTHTWHVCPSAAKPAYVVEHGIVAEHTAGAPKQPSAVAQRLPQPPPATQPTQALAATNVLAQPVPAMAPQQ